MKHKKDFLMQRVADLYVVVPVAEAAVSFNAMFSFNETGALLWNRMDEDVSEEALMGVLIDKYSVDEKVARHDVRAFVERLSQAGLLEEQ